MYSELNLLKETYLGWYENEFFRELVVDGTLI